MELQPAAVLMLLNGGGTYEDHLTQASLEATTGSKEGLHLHYRREDGGGREVKVRAERM